MPRTPKRRSEGVSKSSPPTVCVGCAFPAVDRLVGSGTLGVKFICERWTRYYFVLNRIYLPRDSVGGRWGGHAVEDYAVGRMPP